MSKKKGLNKQDPIYFMMLLPSLHIRIIILFFGQIKYKNQKQGQFVLGLLLFCSCCAAQSQPLPKEVLDEKETYTSLTAALQNSEEVYKLDLTFQQIDPLEFEKLHLLRNLQILNLSQCYLPSLPQGIGELRNLQFLNLNNNALKKLPRTIGRLENLKTLMLSHNYLDRLPETFGQLDQLELLDLQHNQFYQFPEILLGLEALKELILSENKLQKLPSGIGGLKSLQILWLEDNQLEILPLEIGKLSGLKWLMLGGNQLNELPHTFKKMGSLRWLRLPNNKFEKAPPIFGTLRLENLDLKGNPLLEEEFIKIKKWLPETFVSF